MSSCSKPVQLSCIAPSISKCVIPIYIPCSSPPSINRREHRHHYSLKNSLPLHLIEMPDNLMLLFTWTLNKGPVVVVLHRTHRDIEDRLQAVFPWRGWVWHLDRTPVRAFKALPLPGVTGICAPPTARLLQALSTCAVA